MAAVKIGSPNISLHLSNDKLVVMMVDFLPARREIYKEMQPDLISFIEHKNTVNQLVWAAKNPRGMRHTL